MKSTAKALPARTASRVTDRVVREALIRRTSLAHAGCADTLIVQELGLEHGLCRVDVAVVNGRLHGYEIKSDADTLNRLALQAAVYSRVFDRVTLVVGEHHLANAKAMVPEWWGIHIVSLDASSNVRFDYARREQENPLVSGFHLAHLLWRSELLATLERYTSDKKTLRGNRLALCEALAAVAPLDQLREEVRECLKRRTAWRDHA